MSVSLYIGPAASGKTGYLVARARQLARDPAAAPRVVVPSRLQVQAWRRRLAEAGGTLGVHVTTFDALYHEILDRAGVVVTRLTDPVQVRLLRALVDETPLTHYASLRAKPGFVQVLRDLIGELKAGGVFPEQLAQAVDDVGGEARLVELARLYTAYQERLQQEGWADYAGIGWLAAETLAHGRAPDLRWPCLMVDGFDDLTTVQLRVIAQLAERVDDLTITLTGTSDPATRPLVHKRFNRTRRRLEAVLDVEAEPLPTPLRAAHPAQPLIHLERALFDAEALQRPAEGAVTLIAAPDREGEVRAALRWIKTRLVKDGMQLHEVALLTRDVAPYRAFIDQTAAELGLPLKRAHGLPLRKNPAVAALLDLLVIALPGENHLAWRETVAAWRSPTFDWENALAAPGDGEPIGITAQDAEALDWVARWGSVMGGMDQWEETFDLLSQVSVPGEALDEDSPEIPDVLPTGAEAEALREKFRRFVRRIGPPEGERPCRELVAWVEALIGDTEPVEPDDPPTTDLGVAQRAVDGPSHLAGRDLAALNGLKDILRGLVWAEAAVGCPPLTFGAFLDDLSGAVDAASYRLPLPPDREGVLVADVTQARGLPLRAVAVLGLAEGEFPQTLAEDPFLRDGDRARLRDEFGLAIDLSTDSAETEYFYETVTRPREGLLLTRPRIADNGAPWEASPYWEEVRRLLNATAQRLTSGSRPAPDEAASWPELMETLAASPEATGAWAWASERRPAQCATIEHARAIITQRIQPDPQDAGPHDGGLGRSRDAFSQLFGPDHVWSASRLETYRACPFFFFIGRVLDLERREPPREGIDARQLGNIYHHILEDLYRSLGADADLASLQEALPAVAENVLDEAPRREGFRVTAWWRQTRQEIVEKVTRSIEALESLDDRFGFYRAEQTFGIAGQPGPPLVIEDAATGDQLRLHGYIDRVDRADGGDRAAVRVIDYKTAGPYGYTARALEEGKKLQLPLYAMAAERALRLGEVVEGFYWHVQHAQPSSFTLARSGPRAAMATAVEHAWAAARGARGGHFVPQAPEGGCPGYCPAAAFCWRYDPGRWG